jgi:hypothetical protein
MRKLVFIFAALLALGACNSENKAIRNQEAVVVSNANFEQEAAGLVDHKIALEGIVTHVCKHGGKRFFLGEERIKVLASDKIGSFETSLEGSDVYVEGILREERVDEAFLQEWESELEENAEVQEKEVAHKGEPGHDHAEAEAAEDPNAAARQQIKQYRDQLASEGKEYLSFYTVEVLDVKEKK